MLRKIAVILSLIILVVIIIWWRAPILGNEWTKQTIYVGLLDAWYGSSKDDKAYAIWIDDDSTPGDRKSVV